VGRHFKVRQVSCSSECPRFGIHWWFQLMLLGTIMVPKGGFSSTSAPSPLLVLSRPSALSKSPTFPPSSCLLWVWICEVFQCFRIYSCTFHAQTFPDTISESSSKVAPVSFWHVPVIFLSTYFLAQDVPIFLRNHGMKENFSGKEE